MWHRHIEKKKSMVILKLLHDKMKDMTANLQGGDQTGQPRPVI